MKAAVVGDSGLEIREIDTPKPGPAEVLIKVRACGLNRADAMVASGMACLLYTSPSPRDRTRSRMPSSA